MQIECRKGCSGCVSRRSLSKCESFNLLQNARREKLERMGEEILDLWQQLDIPKAEQVLGFGWMASQTSSCSTHLVGKISTNAEQRIMPVARLAFPGAEKQRPKAPPLLVVERWPEVLNFVFCTSLEK